MSLAARLWAYQAERFPLKRNAPLMAVFAAASVSVSAALAGRTPSLSACLAAFVITLCVFFQLRAADEWKDRETDRLHRPERPVPRGAIRLRAVLMTGLALAPVAALAAAAASWTTLALLGLTWAWGAAMTVEFGASDFLRARPALVLVSHMAVMPLIDLCLTSAEWGGRGGATAGLWAFLALSWCNGCVIEIGRKTWAPEAERPGVESWSSAWGPARAAWIWAGCVTAAAGLLACLGAATGAFAPMAAVGAAGAGTAIRLAAAFARRPDPRGQARIDAASGIWVLVCYAAAGAFPFLSGAI